VLRLLCRRPMGRRLAGRAALKTICQMIER
jgi:hypothetical protein